jgi:hypothetical protein
MTVIISSEEIAGTTVLLAEQIELIEDMDEYTEAVKDQYLTQTKSI